MRSVTLGLLGLFLTTSLMAQEVHRIEIQPGAVEASIGDEIKMSATAYDAAGNVVDAEIRWFTSYEIGTMLDGGVFLATNSGEAIIGAIAGDQNANVPVHVGPLPPSSLEVTLGAGRITATSWLPLEALAYNSVGGRVFDADIAWSSSDERVASVVGGFLVGHRTGTVRVSASAGDASADTQVTVVAAPSGDLTLDQPEGTIRTGDVYHLAASVDSRGLPVGAFPRYTLTGPSGRVDTDGAFVASEPGDYIVVADYAGASAMAVIAVEERAHDRELELVGRGGISYAHTGDLWAFRNAVYVGNYGDQALRVFDISDPANPVMTDSIVVDARRVNDVKVNEEAGYAIMTREGAASRRNGILVLDIADPHHPQIFSEYTETVSGGVHNVFLVDELVYAVHNGNVHIIDVSDRRNPVEVGRWGLDKQNKVLHDIYIKDGIAYLSYWDDGLVILDLGGAGKGGTPTEPQFVSRVYYPEGNTHVAWRWKDYVFVGDEFFPSDWNPDRPIAATGYIHVFDVTDLENPVEVGRYEVPEGGAHNVWIEDDDDTLYVGYYQAGLRAIDVSGELRGNLYDQGRQIDAYLTTADENVKVPNAPFTWGAMIHDGMIFSVDFNSGLWIHKWVPTGDRPIS